MIHIEVLARQFECGDTVIGSCAWAVEKAPRSVRVMLEYYTEGRGDEDRRAVATKNLTATEEGDASFEFKLPTGGPVSYNGDLIRVIWQVRVLCDLPWASDSEETAVITVRAPHDPTVDPDYSPFEPPVA